SRSVRSNRDLVFVEDAVALSFLREILRRHGSDVLRDSTLVDIGSSEDVRRMVARLRAQGVRAVGVRDPDQGSSPNDGLFAIPGQDACPEALLVNDDNVARAERYFAGIKEKHDLAKTRGEDLSGSAKSKRVFDALCAEIVEPKEFVADRLTLAWLEGND